MSYICENCSTFLLGGFLGPSELFAYWRPASFIIQRKVSWIKFLFLKVSYILNIAKGTTDPRVEFISQVYSSQFTNLDKMIISEAQLSINLKSQPNISISTKFKLKILTKIQLCNLNQTSAAKY